MRRPVLKPSQSMKTLIRSLLPLFALSVLLSAPVSAKNFEGKIVMETHRGKKVTTTTYLLKSGWLRTEVPNDKKKDGDPFVTIMRPADKQIIMLMPEQKQYMVHEFNVEKAAAKVEAVTGTKVGAIEKTGRTDKICGYEVEEYVTKVGNDTIENWVVEGFGFFATSASRGPGGPKPSEWEIALREKGAFSLRTITRDAKGIEKTRTEAISVEKQKLEDELFQAPAGWTQFKVPSLGDMFGGR
jgi:hypothetical protein